MADVVVTLNIMPKSPDIDLWVLEKKAVEKIKEFSGLENHKTEIKPVAFGLKMLTIMFVMPENKGATDDLEENIKKINGVASVEVSDVRRAIG